MSRRLQPGSNFQIGVSRAPDGVGGKAGARLAAVAFERAVSAIGVELCLGSVASTIRSSCLTAARYHHASEGRPQLDEWQTALECLMLVVKLGGPTMFARICIMRALNRRVERAFDPSQKDKHRGRRKLARDR
jgi:hypothetical protein